MNDFPIKLKQDVETIRLPISQQYLDGLYAAINWMEGFSKSGHGNPSGLFELVMFYRSLVNSIHEYYKSIGEESNP